MSTHLSFHDKQHITRLLVQERRVNAIFNNFIRTIAPEMRKWHDTNNRNSVWVRNSGIERFIDSRLSDLQKALTSEIRTNQETAWILAAVKNDELVERYIRGMALSNIAKEGMFSRNLDGLRALQNRVDNGMNLSDRVWKITEQTKGNIELFLESGIATGRSAEAIGRDFRQLLENPAKRFRRIQNEKGELIASQPMKDYHPGQGVYRSSRMNALRVAATETNMGYRVSDCERWQSLDFVLGYEVKRSGNGRPCVVCDALAGKYPKGFIFSGWHPFCICFAVPVMMEHEDFADFLLHDTIPQKEIIRDLPPKARNWMSGYMEKSGKTPMFIEKNISFFNKQPDLKVPVKLQENKGITQTAYPKITSKVIEIENEIRMNKQFETGVAFDKDGNVVLDKRGAATSISFTDAECKAVKDCVFTHNHPRGWSAKTGTLKRIGNSFSKNDITFAIGNDTAEIRAVTPTFTFSMKRPKNGWGISILEVNESFILMEREVKSQMLTMISKAKTNEEQERAIERAEILHHHLIWKKFAEKYGIKYTKTKSVQ